MALDLFSLVAKLTLEDSEYTEALDAAAEAAQAFAAGFGSDAADVGDNVTVMADNVSTSAEAIGTAMDAAVSAMDGVAGASGDVGDAMAIFDEDLESVEYSINDVVAFMNQMNSTMEESGSSADEAAGAMDAVADAADVAGDGMDGVAGAADGASSAMEGVGGGAETAAGGLDQAEGSAGGLASTLAGTLVSGAGAALTAIETMAVGAVSLFGQIAGAITDVVGGLAEYGDKIDKESQKLGISAQAYQEWDAVLQHSGTSMDVLKRGMMTMSTAMDELSGASERVIDPQAVEKAHNAFLDAQADLDAAKIEVAEAQKKYGISSKEAEKANLKLQKAYRKAESAGKEYKATLQGTTPEVGKAAQAIQNLGIEMTDSEGNAKSQEQVFKEVITALQNIEDPAKRAATAQEIFGRSASELGPLLNTSAEDTQAMIDRVHELGGVLSDDAVKGSADFQDAMQDLKTAADGVKNQFIQIMMPAVTDAIENITQLIVDAKPIIDDVAGAVSAAWNGIVKPVLDALWSLASTIVGALVDLWQGTFVPAIEAAWGAIQGIWESTLKPAWEQLRDFVLTEVVPAVVEKWDEFKEAVSQAWDAIVEYWQGTLQPALQELWDFIVEEVVPAVVEAWEETLQPAIQTVIDAIVGFWEETLRPAWEDLQTFVVETLIPAVQEAWETTLQPAIQTVIDTLVGFWEGTLRPAWEDLQTFVVETLIPAVEEAWEGLQPIVDNVFGAIKTAWEKVLRPAFDAIGKALGTIKTTFETIWNGAYNVVKTVIDKLKKIMDFKWELPKLKLPHFKITGKFSLNPPEVPKFSIDWYKKAMAGMIFDAPTILPALDGSMRGFGDAGPEAVVGVSSLRTMIQQAVSGAMGGQSAPREIIVPRADTRPIEITVRLADDTVLGRAIYRMNEAEAQRVGPKLVTGVR